MSATLPVETGVYACVNHPQKSTRLRCTECEQPICTTCMIPCEVGFKCKRCLKNKQSHVVQASAVLLVKMLILAEIIGGLCWGMIYWLNQSNQYLYILIFILLGRQAGNLLQHATQNKQAQVLRMVMVAGFVSGLVITQTVYWAMSGNLWPLDHPVSAIMAATFIVSAYKSYH
jgi:hypothetical protein